MFKKQLKVLVVAMFALALAGVAGAQSASAVVFTLGTEKCVSGKLAECWESAGELLELTGEQTVTVKNVTGVVGILKGTIGSEAVEIQCTTVTQGSGTNVMLQAAPLTTQATIVGKLKFSGCSITGNATVAARCTIPSEKETNALTGTPLSTTVVNLKPSVGTEFIVIPFTTKEGQSETCPVAGNRAVTGEQEVEVPATAHTVITAKAKANSKLKLAGNEAHLTGEIEVTPEGLGDPIALHEV